LPCRAPAPPADSPGDSPAGYDSRIVRQISEADVGTSVVLVFKVVGRGDTALVLGLTRGDTSPIAIKVQTYRIHST
jgi:hypothetical protein